MLRFSLVSPLTGEILLFCLSKNEVPKKKDTPDITRPAASLGSQQCSRVRAYMTSCHGAAYLHIVCSYPYHYLLPRLDKRGIGPFVDLTPWIRRVRLLRVVLDSLVRSAFHLDDTHRTISTFLGVTG